MGQLLHVIFDNPVIPGNTGNAIRLCANTGAHLHLVEPLGFSFDDRHLRRAGLDYHDLAEVTIHPDLDSCLAELPGARVFAFTGHATTYHHQISYQPGDALLFGTEPTGLPQAHMDHPRVTELVRIPMLPARRSMNLSNAAAVGVFEAWRQLGFAGGV
ncbi:tRNA (cytidine(34)-2'-O)-methyltransferase [Corynebacterium sp. c6VSa_13]|uniref:tRNA (cytidine(34)-2'-O)-methyltransferase n=1 Tax=Corynebacterium sp. c6VSa_13 TaxID=2913496 RepID=UPI0022BA4350|nr:tRNA (cytidine(34)-2'-O)-methyltransferase [Corynebacterium sp. c6VSa_13]MCZ9309295.1 tRNA (cytidine(34)-2'-O)-methyltransferase [Corynebacterium sp. c6VSa_13]